MVCILHNKSQHLCKRPFDRTSLGFHFDKQSLCALVVVFFHSLSPLSQVRILVFLLLPSMNWETPSVTGFCRKSMPSGSAFLVFEDQCSPSFVKELSGRTRRALFPPPRCNTKMLAGTSWIELFEIALSKRPLQTFAGSDAFDVFDDICVCFYHASCAGFGQLAGSASE